MNYFSHLTASKPPNKLCWNEERHILSRSISINANDFIPTRMNGFETKIYRSARHRLSFIAIIIVQCFIYINGNNQHVAIAKLLLICHQKHVAAYATSLQHNKIHTPYIHSYYSFLHAITHFFTGALRPDPSQARQTTRPTPLHRRHRLLIIQSWSFDIVIGDPDSNAPILWIACFIELILATFSGCKIPAP